MNAKLRERLARALASSQARDDEGEYERLADLIGFSGENKLWTALGAAVDAILTELEAAGYAVVPIDSIAGPEAWLDRWAEHVGSCDGGDACTCGLTRARYDMVEAILKARPTP